MPDYNLIMKLFPSHPQRSRSVLAVGLDKSDTLTQHTTHGHSMTVVFIFTLGPALSTVPVIKPHIYANISTALTACVNNHSKR